MPVRRLNQALKPRKPVDNAPTGITVESVEGTMGGSYKIRGVWVPGPNTSAVVGAQVYVQWERGRPSRVISFDVRRSGPQIMPGAEGSGIVEELFVGTPIAGRADVYFRNEEQITRLNVFSKLTAAGPHYVGWGLKPDSFFVADGDRDTPTADFKIHVFKLTSGGSIRKRNVAIGSKKAGAQFVKTWSITDIVNLTLSTIQFRSQVTGLFSNSAVPFQGFTGYTKLEGPTYWFDGPNTSGQYDLERDSEGFNPTTIALETHSAFFPPVPYPCHWNDDLEIEFADMRTKNLIKLGDIVLDEKLDLHLMIRADVEGRRTFGGPTTTYPRTSKIAEGTKFQGTGVAPPNNIGADKYLPDEMIDYIFKTVGLRVGARPREGTTVFTEDPFMIKPGVHYFLLNLTSSTITWRTMKTTVLFQRGKRFVYTSEPINFSNSAQIGILGSSSLVKQAVRWNPGLLGDDGSFDPPAIIDTTSVPFATHSIVSRFIFNFNGSGSSPIMPEYRVFHTAATFTFVIPTEYHYAEQRCWSWSYRFPSHQWEFFPARLVGKRGPIPTGSNPEAPVGGWLFMVATRRENLNTFVYTAAPASGYDSFDYSLGSTPSWDPSFDVPSTLNEDKFVGPTPDSMRDVYVRAVNVTTHEVITLLPIETQAVGPDDTVTLYPSTEFHLQWIRNGTIYVSSLRGTKLTKTVGVDATEYLSHVFHAIRPDQFYESKEPAGKFINAWGLSGQTPPNNGVVTLDQAVTGYPPLDTPLKFNGKLKRLAESAFNVPNVPLIDTTSIIAINDKSRTKKSTIAP